MTFDMFFLHSFLLNCSLSYSSCVGESFVDSRAFPGLVGPTVSSTNDACLSHPLIIRFQSEGQGDLFGKDVVSRDGCRTG